MFPMIMPFMMYSALVSYVFLAQHQITSSGLCIRSKSEGAGVRSSKMDVEPSTTKCAFLPSVKTKMTGAAANLLFWC
ncbi:hypothetical protein BDR05DRAFT_556900 [Suillus weaverae]|nr:hypothetical protein BDR05DRAFT_556900 [Suillus weaverae]